MKKVGGKHEGLITWHLPKPRGGYFYRPFAGTTKASSDLIEMLAEDGLTWSEIAESIRYDDEAKHVAETFVDNGFGNTPARVHISLPHTVVS